MVALPLRRRAQYCGNEARAGSHYFKNKHFPDTSYNLLNGIRLPRRYSLHKNPIPKLLMDKHDYRAQPPDAGTPPDAPRAGHAPPLMRTWSRLSARLVPLIGENGFGALLGRTLRMVAPGHPWLSLEPTRKTSAALLAGLEADMDSADAAAAGAAHDALMSTFSRQLGALIGTSLTARLLAESTVGDEKQQNQQEHK
jgi:hypothetical protein